MPATAQRKATPDRRPTRQTPAPLRVVARKSAQLPDGADEGLEYARCRSLGHSWRHLPNPIRPGDKGAGAAYGSLGFKSVCQFCHAERTKWIGYSGSTMANRYDYPDHYQRRGDAKLTPTEWRKTFLVTVMDAG